MPQVVALGWQAAAPCVELPPPLPGRHLLCRRVWGKRPGQPHAAHTIALVPGPEVPAKQQAGRVEEQASREQPSREQG